MAANAEMIFEPFVRRGLFPSPENAAREMARDYVLHQIERHRASIARLESKYGMNYRQFNAYLEARAQALEAAPNVGLNRALMLEEDDALTWKSSLEMLEAWLGLDAEVAR